MNKIIAALIAGLFAVSVNAYAADAKPVAAAPKADVAPTADASKEKPATPAKEAHKAAPKKTEEVKPADVSKEKPATPAPKKAHKKTEKISTHETTSSGDFGRVAPAQKHTKKPEHTKKPQHTKKADPKLDAAPAK